MDTVNVDVLVAGGGIGGLTAALALHRAGRRVRVVERARRIAPLGVGINLQPAAVGVLTALGLGDRLAGCGVEPRQHVYLDHRGTHRFTEARGVARGELWPQYSIHRGALQTMLLDRVTADLGPDAVRTGSPVVDVSRDDDAVRVTTVDRDSGARSTTTAGVVVGADGIHSAVRAALHPDDGPLLHSGTVMWRGVTDAPAFLDGRSLVLATDPAGVLLVAYPIRRPDSGATAVNWVLLLPGGRPGPVRPADVGWNRTGSGPDLLARLRDWDLGDLDVADLVTRADAVLEYPMVDRDPLERWGDGRAVTLLGDAAHPMYPVGANGATQAVLDAAALAGALCGAADRAEGIAAYECARVAPTRAVVEANREMYRADHDGSGDLRAITDRYRAVSTGPV